MPTTSSSESINSTFSRHQMNNLPNLKNSHFCPFDLNWVFGLNSSVPIINLTTKKRTLIAYASSHIPVLYNYYLKKMLTLQGHTNEVRTLSTDSSGKWLLTADFDKDSLVVIWDTEKCVPVYTLFNPHGDEGMTAAKISFDAKYIVTVGNEKRQKLKFWLWTSGKSIADASIELSSTERDRVKEISFNDHNSDQFILTLEYHLLFVTWENEELLLHQPPVNRKNQNFGVFNNSLYLSKPNKAITSTSNGFVLLWSCKEDGDFLENIMYFNKAVRLEKCNITQIARYENIIVLGTLRGHINFYDEELKLLYWCSECNFDSISSISFDLPSECVGPKSMDQFSKTCEDIDQELDDVINCKLSANNDKIDDSLPNFESLQETPISNDVMDEHEKNLMETKSNFTFKIESTCELKNNTTIENFDTSNFEPEKHNPVPTDATMEQKPFIIERFFICTKLGKLAWLDVSNSKCRFVSYPSENIVTALDLHSEQPYMVTGNSSGLIRLFNYVNRRQMISKSLPCFSKFLEIYNKESINYEIIHVSSLRNDPTLKSVTALKYSPISDMLVCGLENGVMWILHPDTLTPLDEIPFKHSTEAIMNIVFSNNSKYMAYSDNAMTVAVFKKAELNSDHGFWNFIGKYHSHYSCIKDLLFETVIDTFKTPRFLSLGEDQFLVEYDLANSGPYPVPGLKILNAVKIDLSAIPLSLSWYPQIGDEKFFVITNSEYKFQLLNEKTKKVRATFLGPTFGAPVRMIKILTTRDKIKSYIIFATDKEIGIQMIPLDGNPYKQVGMIGHHQKITKMCLSPCNKFLFTIGYKDQCVLMWKINLSSVEEMNQLGGEGIEPFFPLIEGGKNGWFFQEMRDLFYYSQILQQGENVPEIKTVAEKISIRQISNLMRSLGFYPSSKELECMMTEISHRPYEETRELVEEISFQDFVKLYINHRPAFGTSLQQFKEAFQTLRENKKFETPNLTKNEFLDVLLGKVRSNKTKDPDESLSLEEAYIYLKFLVRKQENLKTVQSEKLSIADFDFLPESISYNDFATDIMGIELPKERRADENFA